MPRVNVLLPTLASMVLVASVAHGAGPKPGCAVTGKPTLLATLTWPVHTIVTVNDVSYAVAADEDWNWDRQGYSFPGPTHTLVPVEGGDLIQLQAPTFDGYQQGAWAARTWLGIGSRVVAVGPHPSGSGIVIAHWQLPDTTPTITQIPTGKFYYFTARPKGPFAASVGDALAVVWVEARERLASPGAQQRIKQNHSRVMAAVLDLKTGKPSEPIEVVQAEVGEGRSLSEASGNVVANADSSGFIVLQTVKKTGASAEDGEFPLSWRPLSVSGSLGEVQGQLPWEAWREVLTCGRKLHAQTVGWDEKALKAKRITNSWVSADLATGKVTTVGESERGYSGLACDDGTPISAWQSPPAKQGAKPTVRFAPMGDKPAAGIVVATVEPGMGSPVPVAVTKQGPLVIWHVNRKTEAKVVIDVMAQRVVCSK